MADTAMDDETSSGKTPPTLTLDMDRYLAVLASEEGTDTEKCALIEAMWDIVCTFVRLGWRVEPIQHAMDQKSCGQISQRLSEREDPALSMLHYSSDNLIETFIASARAEAEKESV